MIDGVITGVVNVALFCLVVLIRRLVHHEGLAAFGLQRDARSWRLLLAGLLAGTLLFSIYPTAAVAFGLGSLSAVWPALATTALLAATWGFGFAGVALFEEALFRGYLLSKLSVRLPTTAAIVGQALLFSALHLAAYPRGHEVWLGLFNVAGLGIVLAMLVLRTQSLMAAIGFHAAWDLVQTILLMHQNRNVTAVLNLHVSEGLWTGTAYTPETGLIVTGAVAALALLVTAHTRTTLERALDWRDGSV